MYVYPNTTYKMAFQPKTEMTDSVLLAFGIPIFLANIIGIVVVWQSTKLPFQIRLLTLNLSYADGGIGLVMLLPRRWLYKECNVRKYLLEILGTSSFLTITAFNVDRCLVILYAIQYTMFITKSRIFTVCVVIWILSSSIVYLLYSDEQWETLGFSCEEAFASNLRTSNVIGHVIRTVIILINVLIMVLLCLYLRDRMKQLSRTGLQQFKVKHWDYQAVTIKKILLITIMFTVLYTPYMICQLILSTHVQTRSEFIIKGLSAMASLLNSFVNPFLYIFRFKECRFQFKLLFCRWNKSILEETERVRKQSFATYTIDDSMKLRLQAIHNSALRNENSETSKLKLHAMDLKGQSSTSSASSEYRLHSHFSRRSVKSNSIPSKSNLYRINSKDVSGTKRKSVGFALPDKTSESTTDTCNSENSQHRLFAAPSKILEKTDSEISRSDQEDTVLQTYL